MRYGQLVLGPAGSGKSTYCSTMVKHFESMHRRVDVVNLDPAAEYFDYNPIIDIRELVSVQDAMEDDESQYGPNGALVYCMEQLMDNLDWLQERLEESDDDYILFDIPGQIELFTHFDIISRLVVFLENLDFRLCGIFLLDSQFITDVAKFISGAFVSLSTMVNVQLPFINFLTKTDLLSSEARSEIENFLEFGQDLVDQSAYLHSEWAAKYQKLTTAVAMLLDDYSLVKFRPFTITDEELIGDAVIEIDGVLQFAEDADVKCYELDEQVPDENGLEALD